MLAAIGAAESGARVLLLEKNEKLGKKIYITGKGRCNLTNTAELEEFLANTCSNAKFLYSALAAFDHDSIVELMEKAGCHCKVERGGRVFPVSDHASDVTSALKRTMDRLGVEVRLHSQVDSLLIRDDALRGVVLRGGERISADRCIVCTGGLSYPTTGSTGDGFTWAEKEGLKITAPHPALVPMVIRESWCKRLQGLSLKNVSLRMEKTEGKKPVLYEGFGEMLFTHFGVSGPLVLSASSFYEKRKGAPVRLILDLKPALSAEQLDQRLLREFEEQGHKDFHNMLGVLLPAKMVPVMTELSGIDAHRKAFSITRAEREKMISLFKGLEMHVENLAGFEEAIITQGGISTSEIVPGTMESRKIKGLYFAGEVLDLDALTGGFNLQIAWSTGYLAGVSAADVRPEE